MRDEKVEYGSDFQKSRCHDFYGVWFSIGHVGILVISPLEINIVRGVLELMPLGISNYAFLYTLTLSIIGKER